MMKTIEFKVFSYSGKDKANEDYASCLKLSDTCLVAVLADGMGGLSYGAEAAKIVSESIMAAIRDNVQECSPEEILRMAFDAADVAIYRKCRELKCRMGAAVTIALVMDSILYYAWQGNVRLYKVLDSKLSLLTTDHIVEDTEGTFLTRCINGKGFRENIPVMYEELDYIDEIIICSDGCYQHMNLMEFTKHSTISFAKDNSDDCSLIEISFV